MGCWNMGILESWVLNASIHHFTIPIFITLERGGLSAPFDMLRAIG